jgi:hypothetical protein
MRHPVRTTLQVSSGRRLKTLCVVRTERGSLLTRNDGRAAANIGYALIGFCISGGGGEHATELEINLRLHL